MIYEKAAVVNFTVTKQNGSTNGGRPLGPMDGTAKYKLWLEKRDFVDNYRGDNAFSVQKSIHEVRDG